MDTPDVRVCGRHMNRPSDRRECSDHNVACGHVSRRLCPVPYTRRRNRTCLILMPIYGVVFSAHVADDRTCRYCPQSGTTKEGRY